MAARTDDFMFSKPRALCYNMDSPLRKEPIPRMKAIIWDMDGTLTDTETYWTQNIFRLLEHYGVPDPRGREAPWFGTATSETIKNYLASPDCRLSLSYHECRVWCRNYIYTHTYAQGAPLKPGALETLRAAKALGVPMCLLSASEHQALKYTLYRLDMGKYFDFWESTCFKKQDKTAPALFRRCAARMGVETQDCLLVEDALYSMQTGKSVGMTVWGIEDAKQIKQKQQILATADRYFTNHYDLAQALREETK